MAVKQVWMSQNTRKKSRYGLRTMGGILGIVMLALVLILAGTQLRFYMGWPSELFSVILCLGVTALMVVLAVRLGWRSADDATVFFLTQEDQLFVLDARFLADYGIGFPSYVSTIRKTEKFLHKLANSPDLPAQANEILRVEKIKENFTHYALVCQVRLPSQRVVRRTCFLAKRLENLQELLLQLERRESWQNSPELAQNRNPVYIFLSVLACGGFSALCVLSHPAVAQLPQGIYFPCLAAAFGTLCCGVWFAVRQHRGE